MIVKSSPGVFKCGHLFQRGDLPIYIVDGAGSPFSPYSIKYTLLYHPKPREHHGPHCSHLIKVFPCHRMPVQADIGEYYATGYAGEGGQSGQWYVEWVFQEYFEGPLQEDRFGFEVFSPAEFHHNPCRPDGHHHGEREWLEREWGPGYHCCGGRRF